jgi:hypothetical protein
VSAAVCRPSCALAPHGGWLFTSQLPHEQLPRSISAARRCAHHHPNSLTSPGPHTLRCRCASHSTATCPPSSICSTAPRTRPPPSLPTSRHTTPSPLKCSVCRRAIEGAAAEPAVSVARLFVEGPTLASRVIVAPCWSMLEPPAHKRRDARSRDLLICRCCYE